MAKVLFINPVIRMNDKPRHIPYGMAQLVAIAVKDGHKVQVFDTNAWRPKDKEICDVLSSDDWDVVATGGLITTYGFIKKIVKYARAVCPSSLIVTGGGFITPIPYEIMEFLPEVDIGVIGEAYITLPEILKRVDAREFIWNDLKGIIFRSEYGSLCLNEEVPLLNNLDDLPFPAWDYFPLEIYFKNSNLLLSEESMLSKAHLGLMASYGCPYKCKYCFHLGLSGELKTKLDINDKRQIDISSQRNIRVHSPSYVIEMVKYVKNRYGVDFISFLDENFAFLFKNHKWFNEFSNLWMSSGLQPDCISQSINHDSHSCKGIHWGTTAHVGLVSIDMLKCFRNLGCSHLDYGLESFSDDILASIGKSATVRDNEIAIPMTLEAGIRPIPNQMFGFPEESFDSIKANLKAWQNLAIKCIPFFATPYPGCEWYFEFKDKILEQYNGNLEAFLLDLGDATKLTAVISKNFNAVELLGLRELMVNHDMKRINEYEVICNTFQEVLKR